ncbi:rod-binding protein [Roseomonas sp. 18066]|uniref:rod-binding protein n=1 Tax=Roseomonas sp. 18066 TaxID=2681412 RepID=UPI00135C781F|nr:rod-binding protein [Roseomonas sp. 18066]
MQPVTQNAAVDRPAGPAGSNAGTSAGPGQVRRLARQLEASFAAELLRAARPPQKEGLGGRGTGGDAFDSFMDQALGEALVARNGLGLGTALERAIAARANPARGGRP